MFILCTILICVFSIVFVYHVLFSPGPNLIYNLIWPNTIMHVRYTELTDICGWRLGSSSQIIYFSRIYLKTSSGTGPTARPKNLQLLLVKMPRMFWEEEKNAPKSSKIHGFRPGFPAFRKHFKSARRASLLDVWQVGDGRGCCWWSTDLFRDYESRRISCPQS